MDMATLTISPDQPYIHRLTRLAMDAVLRERGLAFADEVMSLIWNGETDDWDQGDHLADAVARAGLDLAEMDRAITADPDKYDSLIEQNQADHRAAGHWGVPTMVFEGEPFYGQDRFDVLLWRMTERGLMKKT